MAQEHDDTLADDDIVIDQISPDDQPDEPTEQPVGGEGGEGDDHVVTVEGEEPVLDKDESSREWVRDLRHKHKEYQRRIKELEEKASEQAPETKPVQLGQKPTLEGCEYDPEAYELKLDAWHDAKRKLAEQDAAASAAAKAQRDQYQALIDRYDSAKKSLKIADFDDAEQTAVETLSEMQQGIILQGAESPAAVMYAIGKNPKRAKELAAITDPVKYAFEIAKLEAKLTVTKKSAPPPEKPVSQGSGKISGAVDGTLDRLRADAEKTGDYTKVLRYKAEQRKKT